MTQAEMDELEKRVRTKMEPVVRLEMRSFTQSVLGAFEDNVVQKYNTLSDRLMDGFDNERDYVEDQIDRVINELKAEIQASENRTQEAIRAEIRASENRTQEAIRQMLDARGPVQ